MNRYKLIGIEPISENEISSYTFDGTEIQEKPLNPNEEFIQLTSKIDFKKLNGETLDYTSLSSYCNDEESDVTETHQSNITEKLKKHLTCSIEEINALIDILQITSTKTLPYMRLEKLQKDHPKDSHKDGHDENLSNYIAGKKMALCATASTLLNGAARLSKSISNVKDQPHQNTFYSDLALLRKEWRIKWYQTHLVGDLGLTSCGSVFSELGGFQIMEEEKDSIDSRERDIDLQSLKVVLMHNQEGEPIMRINVNDSSIDIGGHEEIKSFMDLPPAKDLKYQIDRLNRGQNLLFLSEIFSTLCWEARLLNSPVLMKEYRLSVNLRGRNNLEIDFFILPEKHWFGYQENVSEELLQTRQRHGQSLQETSLMSDSVILLLRELLREKHRCNLLTHVSLSNPVAGPVQIPHEKRFHGVQWYRPVDRSYTEQNHIIFLLPTLIDSITFQGAKKELLVVLEHTGNNVPHGISFISHVNSSQSMVNCSINLTIEATNYTAISKHYTVHLSVCKAVTQISVATDQVRHQLVYDSIDTNVLAAFFESQVWNFKFEVMKQLALVKHRWQLIDIRLTNWQRAVHHEVNVGLVVLSASGSTLLEVRALAPDVKRYQVAVWSSTVADGELATMTRVDLADLERRLVRSDLEVIDVLLAASD